MLDIPIVDAHVHLWDPDAIRIPWLDGVPQLNQRYGPAEFDSHTAGLVIDAYVYVQVEAAPAYGLLEARWAAEQARCDTRLQAIVAWAPLEYGDRARGYLDALVATDQRLRGVRRLIQTEADPTFCLTPDFVRGVQMLAEYGWSFDLGITHQQLTAATELVRRCPNTSFILDHLAMPDIAGGQLDPWRADLAALAALPNVMCKVSGLTTAARRHDWTLNDLAPYVEHTLACFGEDRVIFGGDWPVVLLGSTYRHWAEALDALTAGLSVEARRKLWSENARRCYCLHEAALATDGG